MPSGHLGAEGDAGFTEMPPDPRVEELEFVDVWLGS